MLIGRIDLAPFAARRASAALGRSVAIGSLHVTPGRWLTVELDGLRIDNLPGGSAPAMAELRHLSAEVEALSLLHGPTNIRGLAVDGLTVLLEHVADGRKNWKSGPDTPGPAPADRRASFPTLGHATLHAGEITVVTSSGKRLRTRIDDGVLEMRPSASRLSGTGAYNGTPLSLAGEFGPLARFRDGAAPFPVGLHLASGDSKLDFTGTMTDPLNVDGAHGALALDAPTLKALLALAGVASDRAGSLRLAGTLDRTGDRWRLDAASGALDANRISAASLRLDEGGRGQPDHVAAEIGFERLDLDALLDPGKPSKPDSDVSLAIDRAPGTFVAATVTARELVYAGFKADDVRLEAAQSPGAVEVKVLAFGYLGATARASGRIEAEGDGGRVTADVSVAGADVGQFSRALSFGAVPVAGRLDAAMVASGQAATLNEAVRGAQVSAVLTMKGGSIARDVIELASVDVRRLFRKPSGMTPVSCLLAVVDMRAGVGSVRPLRVRAGEGTIAGDVTFDLYSRHLDMTIGSQSATTGFFALDVPLRVSGSFASPSVAPARWSAEGRALLEAPADSGRLPPTLREMARGSACSGAR